MAFAYFTVNKLLDFSGNMIRFDASGSTGTILAYIWQFDDGGSDIVTTEFSADYAYENYGNRNPFLNIYDVSAGIVGPYYLSEGIVINPAPSVAFSGEPAVNLPITFWDANGPNYQPGTIDRIEIYFGDFTPTISGTPTDTFIHTYTASGTFTISIIAYDISGNSAARTRTMSILEGSTSVEKGAYITVCGPETRRIGPCKNINLTKFLPDYLQETDIFILTQFFEDFLNTMYSGLCGFQIIESATSATSATTLQYAVPSQNLSEDPRISILEKIKRLTDFHDPDLIDAQYLQFFADYLGYNVKITRNEIGGFGTFDVGNTVCSAADSEKYLRFTISELPHWYKIKTTRDMIRVMLYSFGLIGDIIQYYTKNYSPIFSEWKADYNDDLKEIPDTWFPTPHFGVKVDIDQSIITYPETQQLLKLLMTQGDQLIRAIQSVRPINGVFHSLIGITSENIDIWAGAQTRFSRYIRVDNEGAPADWWIP